MLLLKLPGVETVDSVMLGTRKDKQVLRAVIELVAIEVMNMLTFSDWAPDHFFRNPHMHSTIGERPITETPRMVNLHDVPVAEVRTALPLRVIRPSGIHAACRPTGAGAVGALAVALRRKRPELFTAVSTFVDCPTFGELSPIGVVALSGTEDFS
jgi:hypothetical protein